MPADDKNDKVKEGGRIQTYIKLLSKTIAAGYKRLKTDKFV